jgi:hypothetical protein
VLYQASAGEDGLEMVVFGGRHSKDSFCADTYAYQVNYKLWQV